MAELLLPLNSAINSKDSPGPVPTSFWQHKWVQDGLPWASSLILHIGLIILGLMLIVPLRNQNRPQQVQAFEPDTTLSTQDTGGIPNPGIGKDPTQPARQSLDRTSMDNGAWNKKNSNLNASLSGGGADGENLIAAGQNKEPGNGKGTGGGFGDLLGAGSGGPLARFGPENPGGSAGTRSPYLSPGSGVKSVVYVCDGSGSLVGGKDETLRLELRKAVNALVVPQSFNVLIFQEDSDAKKEFTALGDDLFLAKKSNKDKLNNFVDTKLTFHGKTNPMPALEEAFREHPQLIYLLTDGAFDDPDSATVVAKINELNKDKRVKINTLLLLDKKKDVDQDKQFEDVMKKIAGDNGGVYKKFFTDDL